MKANEEQVQKLIDYLLGNLEPEQAEEVERELGQNPDLRDLLGRLRETRKESADIDWSLMRSSVHSLVSSQLKEVGDRKNAPGGKQAVTVFDSKLLPLPEGVRPAAVDTRRLKYRIGDFTLEISMYPISRGSYEIIGQLGGAEPGRILQAELQGNDAKYSVQSNEHQVFRFPRVQTDTYRLEIRLDDSVVAVANLEL